LVCLENTHNGCGGVCQTPDYMIRACKFAHERGLYVHLDGARIFNAAVAQGVEAKELARTADSVTFCLSKGLCAPVGSILCGSKEFIHKSHRLRKMVGGGMRQAGILAAAGIVALKTMTNRLVDDHVRARNLADGIKQLPGISLYPEIPATNMIFLSLTPAVKLSSNEIYARLKRSGVLADVTGLRSFRLVLHYWIDDAGVEKTIAAFRDAVQ
jgi:threonine aldolase